MSKFGKLAEALEKLSKKEAEKILAKVGSAEEAVKLKGADREAYLKALDVTYGDQATRAKDMGFGKQQFYHGTPNANFDKFYPNLAGKSNTLGPGRDLGTFFTSNPKIASEYATETGAVMPVKINRKNTSAMELEGGEFGFDDAENAKLLLEGKPNVTIIGDKGVPSGYEKNLQGNTVIVKNPSSVRSSNAAFDPRFKDSDLIMAAKGNDKSVLNKLGDAISAPQRYTMKKLAELFDATGDSENSEESARNIVDAVASKVGAPDNALTNAVKALGVAGLEVFADPTNLVPVGKLGKMGAKAVQMFNPADYKSLLKLNEAVYKGKVALSPEVAKKLEDSIKAAKPLDVTEAMPEKFKRTQYGLVDKVEPKADYGKVEIKAPEQKIGTVRNIAKDAPEQNTLIIKPGQGMQKIEGTTNIPSMDLKTEDDYKFIEALKKR